MDDFYVVDVPNFSDWVFNEREHAQKKYFKAQLIRSQYLSSTNRVEEALNALTKLIEIDPLNETVYFYLMQYQYLSNNKAAAINTCKYNIMKWKNEYEKIDSSIRNKTTKEDVLLFNMFETLINGELSEIMIIRIWNFHFLDSKTIEFISYLLRRKLKKQIVIHAIFDDNRKNAKAESFIKICQSMKDVKITTD